MVPQTLRLGLLLSFIGNGIQQYHSKGSDLGSVEVCTEKPSEVVKSLETERRVVVRAETANGLTVCAEFGTINGIERSTKGVTEMDLNVSQNIGRTP